MGERSELSREGGREGILGAREESTTEERIGIWEEVRIADRVEKIAKRIGSIESILRV